MSLKGYGAWREAGSKSESGGVILALSMGRSVYAAAGLQSQNSQGDSEVKKSTIVGIAGSTLALLWTQSSLAQLS